MAQEMISVGIDIGTTTNQLIFSKLTLKNTAGDFVVPRIEVIQKEILYKSPIYFTPLLKNDWIDTAAIKVIIETAYKEALLKHGDMGQLLGYAIADKMRTNKIILVEPKEKIGATVIGAGNHSMHISGSMVFFEEQLLPLKNCPIVKIHQSDLDMVEQIRQQVSRHKETPVVLV